MDRTLLILEVLNFNKEALQILGDAIEEEGNAALAQKTRARKFGERRMLHLGLELIPARLTVQCATEFFEHAVSFGRPHQPLNDIFRDVKKWANEVQLDIETSESELDKEFSKIRKQAKTLSVRHAERDIVGRTPTLVEQVRSFFGPDGSFSSCFWDCRSAYSQMLEFANDAILFEREGNRQKTASRNNAVNHEASMSAKHCRDLPRIIGFWEQQRGVQSWERLPYASEQLKWQLEQLKVIVKRSISAPSTDELPREQ